MRDILLIIRRELFERVRARSFLVGTLLFPLLILVLFLLPVLAGSGGTEWTVALVNEGPPEIGRAFAATLEEPAESEDANTYRVIPTKGTLAEVRDNLAAQVERREIRGYVVLPADVLEGGAILFRARSVGSFAVMQDLRRAGTRAVQGERFRGAGIDAATAATLIAPVQIKEARITAGGEEGGGAVSTFLAAYVVAFLIYLMTMLYGVAVMHSVLEEKTNRIAEVLMSTIRASHLMAGKIIGVGSAALLQALIWVAMMVIVATQSHRIAGGSALPESVSQAMQIEPLTTVLFVLFFMLGFFLYAALFAAVGAAVTSEQETQSLQFVAIVPLIAPLLFLRSILNAPLGTTATTLGLVPFTAPVAMPMRMAAAPIPGVQITASLALLVVGIAAVAWVAGKIYRVGMLSTGKRPTLPELARWIRSA